MLGKPVFIDELSIRKEDSILIKIETPTPAKLNQSTRLFLNGEAFPIHVMVEHIRGGFPLPYPSPSPWPDDRHDPEDDNDADEPKDAELHWKGLRRRAQKTRSKLRINLPSIAKEWILPHPMSLSQPCARTERQVMKPPRSFTSGCGHVPSQMGSPIDTSPTYL
jgi:hypothetical protein